MDITAGLAPGSRGLFLVFALTMLSGKTTELRRIAMRLRAYGRSYKLLVPRDSIQGPQKSPTLHSSEEIIKTHDNDPYEATAISNWQELITQDLYDCEWILLDEAQYWGESLLDFVNHWYNQEHKNVVVCGLTTFHTGAKWGNIVDLIHMGPTQIYMPHALCSKCQKRVATNTRRFEKTDVLVDTGGPDKYFVVCPDCDQ